MPVAYPRGAKRKTYAFTKFTPEVLLASLRAMSQHGSASDTTRVSERSIYVGDDENTQWEFDNDAEFFALYRTDIKSGYYAFTGSRPILIRLLYAILRTMRC